MTQRLRIAFGVLILFALALPAVAAPDGAVNACTLLTRDEASTAVVLTGERRQADGGEKHVGSGNRGVGLQLRGIETPERESLALLAIGAAEPRDLSRSLRKEGTGGGVAIWRACTTRKHDELQVLKGTNLLIFELRGGAANSLTTAAKQALGRLK